MNSAAFKKDLSIPIAILVLGLAISFSIVFIGSHNALAQQPSGLISRWNGDNVSGRTVTDIGAGNNGVLTGGVTIVSGQKGTAFKFDGSTGRVIMGNPKSLNFGTGPFTLETLFNWDGGGSDVNNIIRKSNYGPGAGAGYWLRIGRPNKTIEFSVGATTGPEGQTLITAPISSGIWHHVIATRDNSDNVRLYIDGRSVGSVIRKAAKAQSTSGSPFGLGSWEDQRSEYFSGLIQEVSVYNQSFGEPEITPTSSSEPPKNEITYPVRELGNCRNKEECHAYCEKPSNSRACLAFVKVHKLLSQDEIDKWEKFLDIASGGGPGGCKNESECVNYCQDSAHIVECTDFVEKYNLVSPQDLAEMRKIAKAVKDGAVIPGGCHNKAECVLYCQEPAHSEECANFLEKAELVSHEDADFIRKSHGQSPGDCARGSKSSEEGKKACSEFCSKSQNQKICMDFAVQVGLLSADDAKELSGGGSLEDFNTCLPHIDSKMLKCFDVLGKDAFEKLKAGQVPEDLKDIKEMVSKMKEVKSCLNQGVDESFSKLPPDGLACLEKELGPNPLEQIKSGKISCRDFSGAEEKIKSCMMEKQLGQLDECLGLSCSEINQCINKLGGDKNGDESKVELDPAISAKMDKIKQKINSCITEQIRSCLAKDCGEMMSCINKLQGQSGQDKKGSESNSNPALQQEISSKMSGCMKQKGDQQGGGEGENGGQGPTADECTQQGGNWNGSRCDFSKKGVNEKSAADECVKQGGNWNGQCDFSHKGAGSMDGSECSKQGGSWDGSKCDFSKKGIDQQAAAACSKQGGNWDGSKCNIPASNSGQPYSGGKTSQEYCSGFSSVPKCSYLGSPDSQNYQLCKQCYPDK